MGKKKGNHWNFYDVYAYRAKDGKHYCALCNMVADPDDPGIPIGDFVVNQGGSPGMVFDTPLEMCKHLVEHIEKGDRVPMSLFGKLFKKEEVSA